MNIFIIDTEYISLSKKKSSYLEINKYKGLRFPEIFQFSMIQIEESDSLKMVRKYSFYVKTINSIPSRLLRLCNLDAYKLNNSIKFNSLIEKLRLVIKNNSLVICNGEDLRLLSLNMNYNNSTRLNKKVYFLNLRKLSMEKFKLDLETESLKKFIDIKKKFNFHDSSDDCEVLYLYLKFIKRKLKIKNFLAKIFKKVEIYQL